MSAYACAYVCGARGPVKMAGSDSSTVDHRSTPTLTSLWTTGAITSAPTCTTSNESEGGEALPSSSVTANAFKVVKVALLRL